MACAREAGVMRPLAILVLLLVAAFAGCAGDPAPDATAEAMPDDAPSDPARALASPASNASAATARTTRTDGTLQAGYWFGGAAQQSHGESEPVAFDVPQGATGVLVELVWDPGEAQTDLDLVVTTPSTRHEDVSESPGTTSGRAVVRLLAEPVESGSHSFVVRCKACVAQDHTVYVTTFEGGPAPGDHTAVPG